MLPYFYEEKSKIPQLTFP